MKNPIGNLSSNAIYAKVHAMQADLLKAEDYEALLHCNKISELGSYLKMHTAYADCFLNINTNQLHRARLEMLVQKSLLTRIAALCAFEKRLGQELHTLLLLRADINYILLCADYFESAAAGDFVYELPPFFQENTMLSLEKLHKARTPQDLLLAVEGTIFAQPVTQVLKSSNGFSISVLENRLYDLLYRKAQAFANAHFRGKEKEQILEVFRMRADMKMLESICRQKSYYHADLSLQNDSFFHTDVSTFSREDLGSMLAAANVDDVLDVVKNSKYGKYVTDKEEVIERKTQWIELCMLQKNLRFSTSPTLCMISFIGILENESRNLTHIIEGIHYHVPANDIFDQLIQVGKSNSFGKECI